MSIRETLQQFADGWTKLGQKGPSFEEFVLEHGKTYHNVEHGKRGARNECFRNAARLVIDSPTAIYVEGYASHKKFGLPLLHAWIERRDDGAAFECTFDDPENFEYFGIRYQTEFLLKQMARHKVWGLLGGHPATASGLVTGDITPQEFKL